MSTAHSTKRPRLGERTMLACTMCKQKKLKCDGQSPQCQNCIKAGRDCLVEDPATGLQRPRDYLQSLEARVAFLESLLREVRPDVAIDHFASIGFLDRRAGPDQAPLAEASFRHNSDGAQDQPNQRSNASHNSQMPLSPGVSRHESVEADEDISDLASDVALLAISAAGREPHYFGPSSALSFSRVAFSTLKWHKRHDGSQPSVYSDSDVHRDTQGRRPPLLPSSTAGHELSTAYFNHVHPQYPFLHRPTILAWEEDCLHAQQAGAIESVKQIPLFFVLMVYAIGSLIIKNGDRSEDAEAYYAAAMDYLPSIIDMDSMQSIQAVIACAVYSIRSPVGASIWKLSGMAIRHCIELGYHRSVKRFRPTTDALTNEMSKRVFWCAYDIDRAVALMLGRPFGIADQMIDVELPLDVDDSAISSSGITGPIRQGSESPPTVMTGAIHIIKLRQVWSKISDTIYLAVSNGPSASTRTCAALSAHLPHLRQQLDQWFAETPEQLQHPDGGPVSVFTSKDWFRLAYDHTILLMYRHCLTCESHRQAHNPAYSAHCSKAQIDHAFRECAASAREICVSYRRTYQRSPVRYTWGSLHILFLAGLTYLHCLWSSATVRRNVRQLDVINTCTSCNMVLVIIAERWNIAAPYRDLFEKLSERTISMVFGSQANDNQNMNTDTSTALLTDSSTHLVNSQNYDVFPQPMFDGSQLDDWLVSLEEMKVPDESEWLVQGLIRGFGSQQDVNMFGGMPDSMI